MDSCSGIGCQPNDKKISLNIGLTNELMSHMSKLKITFIGHASFLIEMGGENILTDPNFSQKVLGAQRLDKPGMKPEDLPPLKVIAVSQGGRDHLDLFSYKFFSTHIPLAVPEGLGDFFRKFMPNPVTEIAENGVHSFGDLQILALPIPKSLLCFRGPRHHASTAFIFKCGGLSIFFAGDSGYGNHFSKIAKTHSIDVALLPIGSYEPRWLMKNRHMNPEEALQAFSDLKARMMIPYHWGSFQLSGETPLTPLEKLKKLLSEKPDEKVKILQVGESYIE